MSFLVCANSIIEHYHFFVPFFSFRNYFTRSVLKYCSTLGEIYDIVIEDMDRQSRGLKG